MPRWIEHDWCHPDDDVLDLARLMFAQHFIATVIATEDPIVDPRILSYFRVDDQAAQQREPVTKRIARTELFLAFYHVTWKDILKHEQQQIIKIAQFWLEKRNHAESS